MKCLICNSTETKIRPGRVRDDYSLRILECQKCGFVFLEKNKITEDFYKNSDLQIKIEDFNSSKVYIVGAVRNQKTIKLDQKPIKLIEAAIEANFNPSAADKLFGTKGFLRRDNEVYKINTSDMFNLLKYNKLA